MTLNMVIVEVMMIMTLATIVTSGEKRLNSSTPTYASDGYEGDLCLRLLERGEEAQQVPGDEAWSRAREDCSSTRVYHQEGIAIPLTVFQKVRRRPTLCCTATGGGLREHASN